MPKWRNGQRSSLKSCRLARVLGVRIPPWAPFLGEKKLGMYDEIRCYSNKLSEEFRNITFQTKDLYNLLESYEISEDDKLIYYPEIYETVPEEQRPYYGKPEWENPFYRSFGCLKSIKQNPKILNYHGVIKFYCHKKDELIEFEAFFTYGHLDKIIQVS